MSYDDWKSNINEFKTIDVRGKVGNFFPALKKQAMKLNEGEGLEIIQSFNPIPLYEVMEDLGYEYHTEEVKDNEYHAYFYRVEVKESEKDIPMRPVALTNMPIIDEGLGEVAVQFWDLTWNDDNRFWIMKQGFFCHLPMPLVLEECARQLVNLLKDIFMESIHGHWMMFLNFWHGIRV